MRRNLLYRRHLQRRGRAAGATRAVGSQIPCHIELPWRAVLHGVPLSWHFFSPLSGCQVGRGASPTRIPCMNPSVNSGNWLRLRKGRQQEQARRSTTTDACAQQMMARATPSACMPAIITAKISRNSVPMITATTSHGELRLIAATTANRMLSARIGVRFRPVLGYLS
jgi:hypothetical protein